MLQLRLSPIGGAVAIVVFAAGVILVVSWVVPKQIASYAQDVFKAENDARATLAQAIATLTQINLVQAIATFVPIIAALPALIGLYFAWQNLAATNKRLDLTNQNLELTSKHLELTKEGQITDLFTKAIELLGAAHDDGKPKFELRLGGIYALERIARDSERDHWPIMEVLTAHVRGNAEWKRDVPANPLATDIQAILTVLRRREWRREWGFYDNERIGQTLNLRGADLHGADLMHAHLETADFEGANLMDAHLIGAHLEGAFLVRTHLERAKLYDAHLNGAFLSEAHLEGALLNGAHLERHARGDVTTLSGAHLEGTVLTDAHLESAALNSAHLNGAFLDGAHLESAYLSGANLKGAHLQGAHLEYADLEYAKGLTQQQVNSAKGNGYTKLPAGLLMPESWKEYRPLAAVSAAKTDS